MRATTLAAGGLACAGAAMTIAAFAGAGGDELARTAAATPAAGGRGAQVFAAQGCGSCHAFAPAGASGPIGPDLTRSLQGKSRDYVLESIVLPDKVAAPGYGTGMMPEDYARRIASQDLDPLVDFLLAVDVVSRRR